MVKISTTCRQTVAAAGDGRTPLVGGPAATGRLQRPARARGWGMAGQ